ncbi:MAG: hypothetical protein ACJA1Z_000886 [Patiriisocius sp.]|jgi:hypothetical protein
MVTAGIKKSSTQGAKSKNGAKSAKPLSRILKSPSKIHKNKPLIIRNIPMTKYPIGLEKKEVISFLMIENKRL